MSNRDSRLDKIKAGNYYSTDIVESNLSAGESRYFYFETPNDSSKDFYLMSTVITARKGIEVNLNTGGELTPAYLGGSPNADSLVNHNLKSGNTSGILINGLSFPITLSDFTSSDDGILIFRRKQYVAGQGEAENQRNGDGLEYSTPFLLGNNTRYNIRVTGDNVVASGGSTFYFEFYVENRV